MNYFIKYSLTFLTLILSILFLPGQTTLQVVTKKFERKFAFDKTDNLIIRAEKGVIDIQPWQYDQVHVLVKVIVKNQDAKMAQKELDYIHWNTYQKNTVLQLYNDIILPYNTKLKSIVRVEYYIRMPQGANLTVQNTFGRLKVSNMNFSGKIDIQYCDLILEKTKGNIDVVSNVGDLNFTDIDGNLNITSKYSSIRINNPVGNISIEPNYGSIKVNIAKPFSSMNITAQRCDVSLLNKTCKEFRLDLEAKYAPIIINESCYIKQRSLFNVSKTGTYPTEIHSCKYSSSSKLPYLKVRSSYGKITMD